MGSGQQILHPPQIDLWLSFSLLSIHIRRVALYLSAKAVEVQVRVVLGHEHLVIDVAVVVERLGASKAIIL